MRSSQTVWAALSALEGARSPAAFRGALKLVEQCEGIEQLAMVDSIRAAKGRCRGGRRGRSSL